MKERKGWAEGLTAKGEREQWEGRMDGRGRRVVEPCIAGQGVYGRRKTDGVDDGEEMDDGGGIEQ